MKRPSLLILAPIVFEAWSMRRAAPAARVVVTGTGPRRSREAAARLANTAADAVAIVGFCGALAADLQPGDLIVASEVRGPDGAIDLPAGGRLLEELRRSGRNARSGAIVSADHLVRGAERQRLGETGALAVDMESAWLAAAAAGRPLAVLRAVVDTPERELLNPWLTAIGGVKAYRSLARSCPALLKWALTP